ncbi:hypothetical protein CSOJ01_09882 [Colletotrichum sojae]|uniref:Uncharacterized protein n=1 Tax=Colletotrichum sojae TaxID=2175907 RepID=A0A8H6J1N8_9PEZI|nr:hypothetical protein CSOJ01_09882 [Colletotrichum sojae]
MPPAQTSLLEAKASLRKMSLLQSSVHLQPISASRTPEALGAQYCQVLPTLGRLYYNGPRNGEASCLSVDIPDLSPFNENSAMPLISPESLIDNYFIPESSCGCTEMLLTSASNLDAALGPRQQHASNQFGRSTDVLETANRTFELLVMCKNKHDGGAFQDLRSQFNHVRPMKSETHTARERPMGQRG